MRISFHPGVLILAALATAPFALAAPPGLGDKAADFVLSDMTGGKVRLSDLTANRTVALVVLRGYPGYQCPYCTRQVQDFVSSAEGFRAADVSVVFVYPGPPDDLKSKAAESAAAKKLPDHFVMLLDPGYEFTNLYNLRWDAANETAFPSTFLIDRQGKVFFAKISNTHGGRTNPKELLDALAQHRR